MSEADAEIMQEMLAERLEPFGWQVGRRGNVVLIADLDGTSYKLVEESWPGEFSGISAMAGDNYGPEELDNE